MNLLLRLQNKVTLTAVISGVLLIVQLICQQMGITFDVAWVNTLITAILGLLTVLGIIVDPTTPGIKDSAAVMSKTDINEIGGK